MQKAGKYIRGRRRWLAAGLACVTAFCAVCTQALTADTLAPEPARVLNCADQVHRHTDACYDNDGNLICGQADFVVHTHDSAACYDGDGELICPLPEIKAYTHTEDCYDEDGSLICEKEEVVLHTHTDACYDTDGGLTCGRLEVLEHVHTDACFADAEMMPINEDDEGEDENEGEQEPDGQEPNEPEPAETEGKYTVVDEFYLWLKARDINGDVADVYSQPEWVQGQGFVDSGIKDALSCTENGETYCLIPISYFEKEYEGYGYRFDPNDTGCCPFVYAPNAYNAAGNLTAASYVYVKNNEITAGTDDTETDGSWYVRVQDTGDYGEGEAPRSNIYYTTYNTQEVERFRFWLKTKKNSAGGYTTVAAYDSANGDSAYDDVADVLRVRTLKDVDTPNYLIPINYFNASENGDDFTAYGYKFDPSDACPFVYAPDANESLKNLTAASYVQVDGEWYVMVRDTGTYDSVYLD